MKTLATYLKLGGPPILAEHAEVEGRLHADDAGKPARVCMMRDFQC